MITLKTLHLATEQEVFDQAANHLLTQMERSIGDGGGCRYRSTNPSGKIITCAAGCFIADEEYTERMDSTEEETTWLCLVEEGVFPKDHMKLIGNLQYYHDNYPPCEWSNQLHLYAERHKLDFKI